MQEKYQNILTELEEFQERCFDFNTKIRNVDCVEEETSFSGEVEKTLVKLIFQHKNFIQEDEGNLSFFNMVFNSSALSQMLNKIKVPVPFYRRSSDFLKKEIFNEHKMKNAPRHNRFRTVKNNDDKTLYVRAVVSSSYTPYDNIDVFRLIFEEVEKTYKTSLLSYSQDEKITRMIISFDDLLVEKGSYPIRAGLSIQNSETGHSSLYIEPVLITDHNTVIYNRSALVKQDVKFRTIHRGEFKPDWVKDCLEQARNIGQAGFAKLLQIAYIPEKTEELLTELKTVDSLPVAIFNLLEEEYEDTLETSRLEMLKKVYNLVKDLPLFEVARIQQQTSSKLLPVFEKFNQTVGAMMEIANEVEENAA